MLTSTAEEFRMRGSEINKILNNSLEKSFKKYQITASQLISYFIPVTKLELATFGTGNVFFKFSNLGVLRWMCEVVIV